MVLYRHLRRSLLSLLLRDQWPPVKMRTTDRFLLLSSDDAFRSFFLISIHDIRSASCCFFFVFNARPKSNLVSAHLFYENWFSKLKLSSTSNTRNLTYSVKHWEVWVRVFKSNQNRENICDYFHKLHFDFRQTTTCQRQTWTIHVYYLFYYYFALTLDRPASVRDLYSSLCCDHCHCRLNDELILRKHRTLAIWTARTQVVNCKLCNGWMFSACFPRCCCCWRS